MYSGITHDVGHPGLAPPLVDRLMTGFTSCGADVASGSRGRSACGHGRLRLKRGTLRQSAEICNELPDVLIRHPPSRHAGMPDAVPDVVEHFTVRHVLDVRTAKIARVRVLPVADSGLSAPVVSVADLAFL